MKHNTLCNPGYCKHCIPCNVKHQSQRNINTGGITMKHHNLFNVSFIMNLVVVLFTVFTLLPGIANAQTASPEFVEFQSIPTERAWDWEPFTIDGDLYLAVANAVSSRLYKWDGMSFVEFQTIPTNQAYDWELFTIGNSYYLAVANYKNGSTYNIDSTLYKWDGASFVEFQSIPTNGAIDWEFFTIGSEYYLALANHYNGSTFNTDSKLYKWDGTSFIEFQSIPTHGIWNWEFFTIGSDSYLAVAKDYHRNNFSICLSVSLRGFAKQSPAHATRLLRRRLLAMTCLGNLFRLRS